ncbi:hypothetical protein GOV07_00345 [Candidatus Woesearchaeota archaeon]|nr:hypothetical protein [Candidatus Woesearchaeota archaeon]
MSCPSDFRTTVESSRRDYFLNDQDELQARIGNKCIYNNQYRRGRRFNNPEL